MMVWLTAALTGALLLPPLNLLLLAGCGYLLRRRSPKWGNRMIATSLLLLLLLSLPLVGNGLLRSLEHYPALPPGKPPAADAIVVLGGGAFKGAPEYGGETVKHFTLERLRYAARLHRATGLPLLASGGRPEKGTPEATLMAQVLHDDFGIDVRWQENASYNTAGNARLSAAILLPAGKRRILLVTHAWHMPRAVASFAKAGFDVVPAPTMRLPPADTLGPFDLLPSATGLLRSYYALHEWVGIGWYKLSGKS